MNQEINIEQIRSYGGVELLAKQLVAGFITGLHKSPFHGFSVEFAEHRLYNTGESTRHIDWKVFGKTDRLYTKRYEEETNLRCHILVDTSSSMYYPEKSKGKIAFALLGAGVIANMLQKQRDAVSLVTFSDKIETQTAVKSTHTHIHQIFTELNRVLLQDQGKKSSSISDTLHAIADKIHKRSMVVIFSDMFEKSTDTDQLFMALQHLRHNNHEVLLFHVTDHATEKDFAFDERPYEFIDIESGEKIKAQPSQVKEYYKKAIDEYYHELKLRCGKYKIDFVEADINKGFDQVLNSFLIRRSKMK